MINRQRNPIIGGEIFRLLTLLAAKNVRRYSMIDLTDGYRLRPAISPVVAIVI